MNSEEKKYFPILEKYALKTKQFTINDASSVTGIPLLETEYSIKDMMEKYDCKNFIFSSTSTVYGDKDNCQETDLKTPMTPYGESKTAVEMLMGSLAKRYPDWRMISLRYFNPCGAHKSGLIGDEPYIYPNNLFPFIQEVICGKR